MKIRKRRQLLLILIVLLTGLLFQMQSAYEAYAISKGKITIKAVDESGEPVEGASAGISFYVGREKSIQSFKGITNADGLFTATSEVLYEVGIGLKKSGYYNSHMDYTFKRPINGKYQPWNPTIEMKMRKIENPVPMYARNARSSKLVIPVIDKEAGFDMMEYDWVSPYGKGIYPDFTFKLEKKLIDNKNFDSKLVITFPNKFDGIQMIKEDLDFGSEFKLPRNAPTGAYQSQLIKIRKRKTGGPRVDNFEEDNNYVFRIRSEEENGKLVKAMYGKIQGEIRFEPRGKKTATIFFKYYLNPDYSRNLEFDPTRNLFGSLPRREHVGLK